MKTINEVRKMFEGDRFAMQNGAVIEEIGDHSATCSLVITDSHRNAMGAVMGGTYFMLADFAFAVAANCTGKLIVSLENNISFSSKYMSEAIRSFGKDKVTLCLNSDSSPIVVKSSEDESLVQLVLPIKTY